MRKICLHVLLLLSVMRCQSQNSLITNIDLVIQINNNHRYNDIFYSQNRLFIISKFGTISSIDINDERKIDRRLNVKNLASSPALPSSTYISKDSIFIAFRKKIIYGNITDSINFHEIQNRGEVKSLRYAHDTLFIFFRNKILVTSLSGKVMDSVMLNLNFDGIENVESPYINFYLSNNQYTVVPFNLKRSEDIKNIKTDTKLKLDRYNIKLYPADLNKGFVPKTISSNCIYWQNIKEPHQFKVTSIEDFSKHKLIELDNKKINFQEILPESIQLSEGDDGILDFENSVQMTNDNKGNIFIMFQAKDKKTKIYSFKVNEIF